jgi:hypothetical protein
MLTGSMLVFGPLLGIIMVFVEPGGTDELKFAVAAQKMLDNSTLSIISMLGFSVAMLAVTFGTAYFARSMCGEQKPGSDLAGLAKDLAFLSGGVVIVSFGIEMAMIDTNWVDKGGDATNAIAIGDAMGISIFMAMGAATLLLGIAIFRQKNLSQIVGGIAALFGACMVGGGLASSFMTSSGSDNIGGLIWFIGFLGWIIITVVIGGITIKQAR